VHLFSDISKGLFKLNINNLDSVTTTEKRLFKFDDLVDVARCKLPNENREGGTGRIQNSYWSKAEGKFLIVIESILHF
jgi:hypothetical protein